MFFGNFICMIQIKVFISHFINFWFMAKTKFTIEYDMQGVPVPLLWQYLFMPQGLELWFADEVVQNGKSFTFSWEDSSQEASLVSMRTGGYVRFHWKDDSNRRTFFELRITVSELTGNRTLVVTDFADSPDDEAEMTNVWNHAIDELKRCIGCN